MSDQHLSICNTEIRRRPSLGFVAYRLAPFGKSTGASVSSARQLLADARVTIGWAARCSDRGAEVCRIQDVSCKLIQQRLRLLQILRAEAFGEPAVNRSKQLIRVLAFALALP